MGIFSFLKSKETTTKIKSKASPKTSKSNAPKSKKPKKFVEPDKKKLYIYNYKRNRSKAANSLTGILRGISCDGKIEDAEILFLQSWLENQGASFDDTFDLLETINEILRVGAINEEKKDELLRELKSCIEYSEDFRFLEDKNNEFSGFLNGIAADNIINLNEFKELHKFLGYCQELADSFPYSVIRNKVKDILADNRVEPKELKELCTLIKKITGIDFTADGCAVGGATSLFQEDIKSIKNKRICLTGNFLFGKRSEIFDILENAGANPKNNLSKSTNILVVGTLANENWIQTSAGRKIEKALELKREGCNIIITSENKLTPFLI